MSVYLIEVKHETITPITLKAGSKQEAIDRVLKNEGEPGHSYHGNTEIVSIPCQDG